MLELADWMRSWQVPALVMEATDVISGSQDHQPCSPRQGCRVRVRDEKGKSGSDEG